MDWEFDFYPQSFLFIMKHDQNYMDMLGSELCYWLKTQQGMKELIS
jgi:hypothetical protein